MNRMCLLITVSFTLILFMTSSLAIARDKVVVIPMTNASAFSDLESRMEVIERGWGTSSLIREGSGWIETLVL